MPKMPKIAEPLAGATEQAGQAEMTCHEIFFFVFSLFRTFVMIFCFLFPILRGIGTRLLQRPCSEVVPPVGAVNMALSLLY